MRFRKKPVVVDAVQWTGNNRQEINNFVGGGSSLGYIKEDGQNLFEIVTLEGTMAASPGDWIIKGVQGERYPVKDDIFHETYEPAA